LEAVLLLRSWNLTAAVILAGWAAAAHAQLAPPLGGPIEAFVFDPPTKSIRAVVGAMGSTSLSEPLMSELDYGSVAPGHSHAMVFQGGRGTSVSSLSSGQFERRELPEFVVVPERIAWSGNGAVAALYSKSQNWVQIIRGLPLSPAAAAPVSIPAGSLTTVVVDQTGDQVIVATSGEVAGVYRVGDSIDFSQPLVSVQQPTSVSFSNDGLIYVLDGATKEVSWLNLTTFARESLPVSDLEDPRFILFRKDNANRKVMYVVSARDRVLAIYNMADQQKVAGIPLDFEPTTIEMLGRNSFLLNTRASANDPLWCLAGASVGEPGIYFVPATPIASREGQDR
jgi:hypothetical protein